jgi:long-chain fatty acid transport protein
MPNLMRRACAVLSAACALGVSASASAGGYDTPMLYSARHMGMGGAAIGYVNDPSAVFHNPAGLAQIEHGEVLGDFSLLLGGIHASPGISARDIDSDLTVAPFFLVGAGYRIQDRITLGVGVYPVASAGATFNYGGTKDSTELFFLEASPAIAFNVLPNLRIGAGYRVTYVRLNRYSGQPGSSDTPYLDFTVTGQNYTGFRVGAQWSAFPWLDFGAVFRNPTTTKVTNTHGTALRLEFSDVSTKFKLPAKLGFGSRADFESFGLHGAVAFDLEYDFNSENKGYPLVGTAPGDSTPTSVSNVFDWSNSTTARIGLEYRLWRNQLLELDRVALRAGYVYDSKTANPEYPTPFGTPPGPTQVVTTGAGYNGGKWQANLAYAYRFGHGAVTAADLNAPGRQTCQFCSVNGKDDYSIHLSGIYVDASYKF